MNNLYSSQFQVRSSGTYIQRNMWSKLTDGTQRATLVCFQAEVNLTGIINLEGFMSAYAGCTALIFKQGACVGGPENKFTTFIPKQQNVVSISFVSFVVRTVTVIKSIVECGFAKVWVCNQVPEQQHIQKKLAEVHVGAWQAGKSKTATDIDRPLLHLTTYAPNPLP